MSTFDCPEKTKLGQCAVIEEVMIGEDKLLRFSGMPCFTDVFYSFLFPTRKYLPVCEAFMYIVYIPHFSLTHVYSYS